MEGCKSGGVRQCSSPCREGRDGECKEPCDLEPIVMLLSHCLAGHDLQDYCCALDDDFDLNWEAEKELEAMACDGDNFIPPKIMVRIVPNPHFPFPCTLFIFSQLLLRAFMGKGQNLHFCLCNSSDLSWGYAGVRKDTIGDDACKGNDPA